MTDALKMMDDIWPVVSQEVKLDYAKRAREQIKSGKSLADVVLGSLLVEGCGGD